MKNYRLFLSFLLFTILFIGYYKSRENFETVPNDINIKNLVDSLTNNIKKLVEKELKIVIAKTTKEKSNKIDESTEEEASIAEEDANIAEEKANIAEEAAKKAEEEAKAKEKEAEKAAQEARKAKEEVEKAEAAIEEANTKAKEREAKLKAEKAKEEAEAKAKKARIAEAKAKAEKEKAAKAEKEAQAKEAQAKADKAKADKAKADKAKADKAKADKAKADKAKADKAKADKAKADKAKADNAEEEQNEVDNTPLEMKIDDRDRRLMERFKTVKKRYERIQVLKGNNRIVKRFKPGKCFDDNDYYNEYSTRCTKHKRKLAKIIKYFAKRERRNYCNTKYSHDIANCNVRISNEFRDKCQDKFNEISKLKSLVDSYKTSGKPVPSNLRSKIQDIEKWIDTYYFPDKPEGNRINLCSRNLSNDFFIFQGKEEYDKLQSKEKEPPKKEPKENTDVSICSTIEYDGCNIPRTSDIEKLIETYMNHRKPKLSKECYHQWNRLFTCKYQDIKNKHEELNNEIDRKETNSIVRKYNRVLLYIKALLDENGGALLDNKQQLDSKNQQIVNSEVSSDLPYPFINYCLSREKEYNLNNMKKSNTSKFIGKSCPNDDSLCRKIQIDYDRIGCLDRSNKTCNTLFRMRKSCDSLMNNYKKLEKGINYREKITTRYPEYINPYVKILDKKNAIESQLDSIKQILEIVKKDNM